MNTDVTYITPFNTSVPSFEGSYLISNYWGNLAGFRNKLKLVNKYRYDRILGTIFMSSELWGKLQFGRCKFLPICLRNRFLDVEQDRSQRDVFEWVTLLHIMMFDVCIAARLPSCWSLVRSVVWFLQLHQLSPHPALASSAKMLV